MAFREKVTMQAVRDLAALMRSFFFFAAAITRSITGCATFTCAAAAESSSSYLAQRELLESFPRSESPGLHPYAIADRLLVNVEPM
jgi:hypothetical protein